MVTSDQGQTSPAQTTAAHALRTHNNRFGAPPADLAERIITVQIGGYCTLSPGQLVTLRDKDGPSSSVSGLPVADVHTWTSRNTRSCDPDPTSMPSESMTCRKPAVPAVFAGQHHRDRKSVV